MDTVGAAGNDSVARALQYILPRLKKRYAIIAKVEPGVNEVHKDKYLVYDLFTSSLLVTPANDVTDEYSLINLAHKRLGINFGLTDKMNLSIDNLTKLGTFWGPPSNDNKYCIIADTSDYFGCVSFLYGDANGRVDIMYNMGDIIWSVEQGRAVNFDIKDNHFIFTNILCQNSKGLYEKVLSKKYKI